MHDNIIQGTAMPVNAYTALGQKEKFVPLNNERVFCSIGEAELNDKEAIKQG